MNTSISIKRITQYTYLTRENAANAAGLLLRSVFFLSCIFTCLMMAACAHNNAADQQTSELLASNPNLEINSSSAFDFSLVDKNKNWQQFNKIYVDMPKVSFEKHWLRKHKGKISQNYLKRIKRDYSKLLKHSIEKTFEQTGNFVLMGEASSDVLRVSSEINDLIINGPETISRTKFLVYVAGVATLRSEVRSPNFGTLAVFEDRNETRDRGFSRAQQASRVSNYTDFKHLMEDWSETIVTELN